MSFTPVFQPEYLKLVNREASLYFSWVLLMLFAGAIDFIRPDELGWTIAGWSAGLLWVALMTVWLISRWSRGSKFPLGGMPLVAFLLVAWIAVSILRVAVWDFNVLPLAWVIAAAILLMAGAWQIRSPSDSPGH